MPTLRKPCPLSRQPTQPADDPSWSKPKPKSGQPTPIPPRNEACLCIQADILDGIDIASVTPLKVNVPVNTVNASGHLEVSYFFTGPFMVHSS